MNNIVAISVIVQLVCGAAAVAIYIWLKRRPNVVQDAPAAQKLTETARVKEREVTATNKKSARQQKAGKTSTGLSHPLLLRTLGGHNDLVTSFGISKESGRIVTSSLDQTLKVWLSPLDPNAKYATTKVSTSTNQVKLPDSAMWTCIDDSGSIVMAVLEKSSKLKSYGVTNLSMADGFEKAVKQKGQIVYMDILRGNSALLTYTDEMELCLWKMNGENLTRFNTHQVKMNDIAVSMDGKFIATAGFTSDIQIYEVQFAKGSKTVTGCTKVMDLRGHNAAVHSVSFSTDNKTVASVSRDGTLKLWNIDVRYHVNEDPKILLSIPLDGPQRLEKVALSPDGKVIAVVERSTVWFYDRTGKVLDSLPNTSPLSSQSTSGFSIVEQIQFMSGKEPVLVTRCENDKCIRLWKVPTV
eukprot:Plantae.Rhodophyta-Purpureofilum_apyrenoidigerum.ctg674.p1 GENE.Plantae.Rhodophyta-Purpureofilum_apyrenoidigerum.ctg674~~Plantae.Rhodophyta-Purpureofilum_apyrenoidigerum.ctg674.p1  ORF type:complete len:411 (-),score=58.13 Plantae.Rhodophyta-Purpureofilum_apyrenoidigerum.ctg674:1081-2313(-)